MAAPRKREQKRLDEMQRKSEERARHRAEFMDLIRAEAGPSVELSEENIKLPSRYNALKLANYAKTAKKRFYKRTGKPVSLKRQVTQLANAIQLNHKYITYPRNQTSASFIVNAAVARKVAAERKKSNTTQKRVSKKQQLIQGVKNAALGDNIVLNDANIKIPVAATMGDIPKLAKAALGRYYKRIGVASPSQQAIMNEAAALGMNAKYVKFLRAYKSKNDVLKAAAARQAKNGTKSSKSAQREQILRYAAEAHQLDEAGVRSVICTRKKAKAE
jgi:hypothetical protein